MSTIDGLIAEMCPNGVVFKPLASLGRRNKGTAITAAKMKVLALSPGPIRVFAGGQTIADVAENAIPDKDIVREPSIIVKSRGHIGFSFYEKPFTHKSELWSYTIDSRSVVQKFVYYYLLTQLPRLQTIARATSVKLPQLSVKDTDGLRIPVPPLPVQQEIVRILDKFTQLEAELEAELEARKVQYEIYRDQLLSFGVSDATWMTLGDIGRVAMCKRVFKAQTSSLGEIPFYKIGTFGKEPDAFISQVLYDELRNNYSFPKKGDVLLSAAGTIGRAIAYDGEPAYFQDSNIVWIDNDETLVSNEYLRFWYQIVNWATDGGTIRRLYNNNIRRAKIAVPSHKEQQRIVGVLKDFETLVGDISVGLPAEITARRKQYEYYRDMLLTFKELPA